jgi:hypothetical protein
VYLGANRDRKAKLVSALQFVFGVGIGLWLCTSLLTLRFGIIPHLVSLCTMLCC